MARIQCYYWKERRKKEKEKLVQMVMSARESQEEAGDREKGRELEQPAPSTVLRSSFVAFEQFVCTGNNV